MKGISGFAEWAATLTGVVLGVVILLAPPWCFLLPWRHGGDLEDEVVRDVRRLWRQAKQWLYAEGDD